MQRLNCGNGNRGLTAASFLFSYQFEVVPVLGCLRSPPPFPKGGRLRLIDFPIEKSVVARPRVDLDSANLTAETAGMLVWMLLPCRGVGQPAIWTAKIFGRPYVACHSAIMRRTEHVFQPGSLPQSMTYYSNT